MVLYLNNRWLISFSLFIKIDNLKNKVIQLLKQKDKGIRGALFSYWDDNDVIALRNRIIHKVMTPTGSREERVPGGGGTLSSVATAGFQQ